VKFRRRVHVYVSDEQEAALRKHFPDANNADAIARLLDFIVEDYAAADAIREELAELRAKEADA
jgi:DNA-binding MarR family transcriptional regulator